MIAATIYKRRPDLSYELLGQISAQMIFIPLLLWKRWRVTSDVKNLEMNTSYKV